MTRFITCASFVVLCLSHGQLHAQVTFDWATVGNPGNAADTAVTGSGAVSDVYRISQHEVTNTQYTEFLNAVAETDTNRLYNPRMDSDARGGITQSGVSGSFSYAVKSGRDNNPVVYVSFFDAMRFVNWLENGQPTGAQGSGTTEDGVYTIGTGVDETRAASASLFIPSEDEWYKAAYHKNDGVTGNYFDYPTSSDTIPTSEPPAGGTNSANYFDGTTGYAVTGSTTFDNAQNYLTDVGAYVSSTSPYGTFDQGGNVFEWTETVRGPFRRSWGGSWRMNSLNLIPRFPTFEVDSIGFRVASIPEPSTLSLFGLGSLLLLSLRRRLG